MKKYLGLLSLFLVLLGFSFPIQQALASDIPSDIPSDIGRLSLVQVDNGNVINQRDRSLVSGNDFNIVNGRTTLRQALDIDGISNVMTLPFQDNINLQQGSISFWVLKPDWSNTQDNFFFREDVSTSYFGNDSLSIRKYSDGNIYAGFEVVRASANVSALNPDTWHLITLTWNINTALSLYIDGNLAAVGPQYDGSAIPDVSRVLCADLCWGGWKNVSYANGIMEDMQIFGYALTPQQILDIYNSSSPATFYSDYAPILSNIPEAIINKDTTYSTSSSFTDPDSTSWTATIDYGEGSGVEPLSISGANFSLSHLYTTIGTYTVTIRITDNQGATGTETTTVAVNPLPPPATISFIPSADTYIQSGQTNRNKGAGQFMQIQASGDNRGLVRFDQDSLQSAVGGNAVISAKLHLTITDNGNNWGTIGRTVDIHRLFTDWVEGNGTEGDRGTGSGVTWACATDTNIMNQSKNCSGATEWEMGDPNNPAVHPWQQSPTATQTILNNQTGIVEYDVTSDVSAFLNGSNSNFGWIIKKTNEGQNGQVSFGTRESTTPPQLIITYQP